MEKIEWPTEDRELTHRVPEHQVVLSFNDDIDAELFSEWWNSIGFESFQKWAEPEKSDRQ